MKKAVLIHAWVNLMKIILPLMGFVLSIQLTGHIVKAPITFNLSAIHYIITVTIVLFLMIVIVQRKNIHEYKSMYRESIQSGIQLKCRLSDFSLPDSSKQLSHKQPEIVTTDIALYEDALRHYLPQLYATIISTLSITLILLIHNLKPGLATLWGIPFALCVFAFSQKQQKSLFRQKKNSESVTGIGIGISAIILKLNIVSMALIGAKMLIANEIDILNYVTYLTVAAGISPPILKLMNISSMLSIMNSVLQETLPE